MDITIIKEPYEWNDKEFTLEQPSVIEQDMYHSSLYYNNKDIFIKTPFLYCTQGIQRTKNLTSYKYVMDLDIDISSQFSNWLSSLEDFIKKSINPEWFDISLENNDEVYNTFMTPIIRNHGKKHYIKGYIENKNILIYDRYEQMLKLSDTKHANIQCILQIHGILYSNTSFQLDIEIKQILVNKNKGLFSKPLLVEQQKNDSSIYIDDIVDLNQNENEEEIKNEFKELNENHNKFKETLNKYKEDYKKYKFYLENDLQPKIKELENELLMIEQKQKKMITDYPHFFSVM